MRAVRLLSVAFLVIVATGCVTGRREFDLMVPAAGAAVAAPKAGVSLDPVRDERRFENRPNDPSTPSIDGDVNSASASQLSAMIGRQRNTYGRAMGDIALPGGETVETKVRSLVAEGLRRRSYSVVPSGEGPDSLAVRIEEFWAWFSPGFAYVTFQAQVRVTISGTLAGRPCELVAEGQGLNKGQGASNANWQLAYTRAFGALLLNLDVALLAAGF